MRNSYLITGGFGLIGSALANSLDGDVTILSRSDKNRGRVHSTSVKTLIKDLNEITQEDVGSADVIFHLASTVDNYNVLTNPYLDVETNINGTIKLLEACKNLVKKPKIVFLSTFFVYGNEYEKSRTPINEESKTDPLAIYPATKLCTESIIKLYSKLYSIPYLILRLTNVYGDEEQCDNKKKGALNYMIMQATKGETLRVYKGGNYYRDFLYVDDVVSAINFLQEKNIENDLFLVGYGEPVLFKDFMSYLHELTGKKSKIEEVDPPSFHNIVGIRSFVADTSKINKLGWKATINYKSGVEKIYKKYKLLLRDLS